MSPDDGKSAKKLLTGMHGMPRIKEHARSAAEADSAQADALLRLRQLVDVRAPLPALRGWSASPDFLLCLVTLVKETWPMRIIDVGSGATTLFAAYALERYNADGRVIALEHQEEFAARTEWELTRHGVSTYAEVRHAPLVETCLEEGVWLWYDPIMFADVNACDLLVIDGPPGHLQSQSRYPAIPVLDAVLSAECRVLLDDYDREDERRSVAAWCRRERGWKAKDFPHEKGTALLTRDTRNGLLSGTD